MNVLGYTDQAGLESERRAPPTSDFAWIDEIFDDGVTLQLGDGQITKRHCEVNASVVFEAGQKVYVHKAGGEYVVICPVGPPKR